MFIEAGRSYENELSESRGSGFAQSENYLADEFYKDSAAKRRSVL